MSTKKILLGKEARDKIIAGVNKISDTVVSTLGPKGSNVALGKFWIDPQVVHDGVSVAKEIELEDKFENVAAQLIRQASSKTNDRAGDGTTTTTLLAQEMIINGMIGVDSGANSMSIKKGMEIARDIIIEKIKEATTPVETKEKIEQVATISSQNDTIGKIIAEAVWKVGKNGAVDVEESAKYGIEYEIKDGMEFEKGLTSPSFANTDKGTVNFETPDILLLDHPIVAVEELFGFITKIIANCEEKRIPKAPLLILADNMDSITLESLLKNIKTGALSAVFVQSPGFAERRKEYLQDIATLTGAQVITKELGMTLENSGLDVLGKADRVVVDDKNTKIIGGYGTDKDIKRRITKIEKQIEEAESDFDKKIHKERIAKLSSGVAIIKVGGLTEVEMKDTKERVIDAVLATKSAFSEGIVYGAGKLLLEISAYLSANVDKSMTDDEMSGYFLVASALKEPFSRLLKHAGIDIEGRDTLKTGYGYDIETGKEVNLMDAGIIDSSGVVVSSVLNSISVASMLITCNAIVVDAENPEERQNKLNI